MKKVFDSINRLLEAGNDLVLVTIIADSGSAPRGAGARMWVLPDGTSHGTIGGGNVEYQAYLKALELLKKKESTTVGYNLGMQDTANIGMVCGGQVVVYFQYISHENPECRALIGEILMQCERDEDAWLLMDISGEKVWSMGLYTRDGGLRGMCLRESCGAQDSVELRENCGEADGAEQQERCGKPDGAKLEPLFKNRPVRMEIAGRLYYAEPVVKAGTVYVFGGGHVAQQLVPVLANLDFKCVVLDDREEFVSAEKFPDAAETILCDFENIFRDIEITGNDYVVIMTRGHMHDYQIQSQVLAKKPFYIGVMGSRSKIAFVTEKLLADGYTREEIEVCHMPIGTNILAETPAEIAISIAGELIRTRAEKSRG